MTPTAQCPSALESANQIRNNRAKLKREIRAGESLQSVILNPPDCAKSATTGDAVTWPKYYQEKKGYRLLRKGERQPHAETREPDQPGAGKSDRGTGTGGGSMSLPYYTADPKDRCIVCDRPASKRVRLVRTHSGWRCPADCLPKRNKRERT